MLLAIDPADVLLSWIDAVLRKRPEDRAMCSRLLICLGISMHVTLRLCLHVAFAAGTQEGFSFFIYIYIYFYYNDLFLTSFMVVKGNLQHFFTLNSHYSVCISDYHGEEFHHISLH